MAMDLHSALLHPALLHQGTRFPRTWTIPVPLSLPAAHIHHQLLVLKCRRSLGVWFCPWAAGLGQPLDTAQVWLSFQLSVICSTQGQLQSTLNSTPQNRGAQMKSPFAGLCCAEPGRYYSHLTPTCEKEIIVRQVQIPAVLTRN